MTAPRNPERTLEAFLTDGPMELPDRAFDAIRHDIHRTRQRVVIGPWREPNAATLSRLAIAAAVVLAVGVVWLNLGRSPTGPGSGPTPMPVTSDGPLAPGRYVLSHLQAAPAEGLPGPSITVTVPSSGWTAFGGFALDKNYGATAAEAGPSFVFWSITNRYVNACTDHTLLSPAPGPTIDALLESLAAQPGIEAGPRTDVTIDGYVGKFVELTVVTDIATCTGGFYPWADKYVQGNGEILRVYALDVDGFRLTFFGRIPTRTTPADLALLESVFDSIDIQP